ncbi:MAG TPA: hypothetical protein PKN95_12010 [Verrucomicrobiota bacterium]|nr:hypothetical protein [Verrucomicrobiota bacterium]HNT15544.1 hypothetical protein [Verrucomicrobiota bacterium]
MAFTDFPAQAQGVEFLQRSLQRGRLGHAYLFTGNQIRTLEALAKTLAKTLNCQNPRRQEGQPVDCCDTCRHCKRVDQEIHGDVFWLRPESRSRQITIEHITHREDSPPRVLLDAINLKASESAFKIAIIAGADRLTPSAANALLKTLEEPPPQSVLMLLSTAPARVLETIVSRCLCLNFGAENARGWSREVQTWLDRFGALAGQEQKSLLGRYQLLDALTSFLADTKAAVEAELTSKSPLEKYDEVEKDLRKQWQEELKAGIEAEYRRRRDEVVLGLQWWLRDIWLRTLRSREALLGFPETTDTAKVAERLTPRDARENLQTLDHLQQLLHTNVQEALALEVCLLKLRL